MYIKSSANLIFVSSGKKDNGSPIELEHIMGDVKVDESESFSANYYNDQQRLMRQAKNLVIQTRYTEDLLIDGKRYELLYVEYKGLKYKVRNILKVKNSTHRKILDLQELR